MLPVIYKYYSLLQVIEHLDRFKKECFIVVITMFKQKITFAILFLAFQTTFAASEYQFLCSTVQFGERLPLNLIEIDSKSVKSCGELCSKNQTKYNSHLANTAAKPKLNTTILQPIKRTTIVAPDKKVYILETRYINYPHQRFKIHLKCNTEKDCTGDFSHFYADEQKPVLSSMEILNHSADKKVILTLTKAELEDTRSEVKSMRAEIMFGPREKSRLIVRLFKENSGTNAPKSSSGEINIKPTDQKIEIDVGVDEQLKIYDSSSGPVYERLATAELKLVCLKLK